MNYQQLREYNNLVEQFQSQLNTNHSVHEADVNSLLVALALAYNVPLPSAPVEDIRSHYIQNCHRSFEEQLDMLGEKLVLYYDFTLRLAEKLYMTRYTLAHNPASMVSIRMAIQIAAQDQSSVSDLYRTIADGVLAYADQKLLTVGCRTIASALGNIYKTSAEIPDE